MKKGSILKVVLSTMAVALAAAPALAVELKLGGYVKLDALWTNKDVGNAFGPAGTPIDNSSKNHGIFQMDARESRFNLTGTEEIEGVKLKGFIEGDFYGHFGDSSSGQFRMRHAYGAATLKSGLTVLAGQTWSNFMDVEVGPPETIDFNGPAGQLFARTPQLRVTYDMPQNKLTLSASVEEHKASGTSFEVDDESISFSPGTQAVPYFTGKIVYVPGPVTALVSGVVTQNRAIDGGEDDTTTAWGIAADLSGKIGPVTLVGHIQRIDGVQSLANGDYADLGPKSEDEIENVESTGWFVGATYSLGSTTFNAIYGWSKADDPVPSVEDFGDDQLETLQTFHVNVLQPLWKKAKVGLEYQWAKAKKFDGDKGSYSRVQAGFWYYF